MARKRRKPASARARREADKLRKRASRLQIVESFTYAPIDNTWRNNNLPVLGISHQIPDTDAHRNVVIPLTPPSAVHQIAGDGNCLFRALSYALTESEIHHQKIRQAICNYMRTFPNAIRYILPDHVNGHVDRYLVSSSMERNGIWGTEVEILTAAVLLQLNVFVYSKSGVHWRWIKHTPPDTRFANGLYLYHKDGNHFDVVVGIENVDIPAHITEDQYYCPGEQAKKDHRKRLNEAQRRSTEKRKKHDPHFVSLERQRKRKTYHSNENVKRNLMNAWKNAYHTDDTFRSNYLQSQRQQYASDKSFAARKKKTSRRKYLSCRRKKILALAIKYHTNSVFRKRLLMSSKKKYSSDASFRSKSKQKFKHKYASDAAFREQLKSASRNKYALDASLRKQLKDASKHKYASDSAFRRQMKDTSKHKYASDSAFRRQLKDASKHKYASDSAFRKQLKDASKHRYVSDSSFRKQLKDSSKQNYATDTTFKNRRKYASKHKYASDSAFRKQLKDASKQNYATDTTFREQRKDASKHKYASDTTFREQVKDASKQKYATHTTFREVVKSHSRLKYQIFPSFRDKVKAMSRKKYSVNPVFQRLVKNSLQKKYNASLRIQQQKKDRVKASRKLIRTSIRTFKRTINDSPRYVCRVCIRLLYRKQVKKYVDKRYYNRKTQKLNEAAEKCCVTTFSHVCDETNCRQNCWMKTLKKSDKWICHTCDRHLRGGNMPPQAMANNLNLLPIPPELHQLNVLERQLVSLRIPFMKLLSLPRGGQKGVKGPVVNVPSDVKTVTTALPRNLNDAQLIKVKLKRKTAYKGHYSYQWINPVQVVDAIRYLKVHNHWYENVNIDHSWQIDNIDADLMQPEHHEDSGNDSNEDQNEADCGEKEQDSSQTKDNGSTVGLPVDSCFQPIDIGQDVLDTNKTLCIAPAENQTPQNIFTENGSEAMAFPTLLPDGHYGLFETRDIKLSPSKYFNARLLSADSRFSSNKEYIFFAQYVTEINKITSNISLALRKGKQTTEDGRPVTASMLIDTDQIQSILKSDVGFRFLQPVRGTPPYWQRTMKDLYAMLHQLGIPTWFVTLSSAELRWPEVMETLLYLNNDNRKMEELEWSEKCSLIAENPLVCARMFDHRVKALFTDFIMSPSCPLGKVVDYFFRTEFQQRGSPHIHCLLWIKDAPKLDRNSDQEVCHFIDQYISCQLPNKDTDPELHDIVSTVQMHSKTHTKSCRKYGTTCRFNFPKVPITRTFIARAGREVDDKQSTKAPATAEEFDKVCKEAGSGRNPRHIMKDVYALVASADETGFTFAQILRMANVTYKEFKQCLIDTAKGNTVYNKRDLADIWVNNYNKDLSRAWNANIDIQYVTDAYACVAYILSYISKAETEMGDLLHDAQKEANEGNSDAASALKKIGSVYMQNREVSAQEAVYRVCGFHLKQCTRDVVFIPAGNNIFRMSLPITAIKSKSRQKDEENIWMVSLHEKYYARPLKPDFDSMCLAEFVSKFIILPRTRKPKSTANSLVYELQNDLGHIRQRRLGKEAVIRYPKFKQDKNPEDYSLSLIQLFVPHRSAITLPGDSLTFENYVKNGKIDGQNVSHVIEQNKSKFEINSKELEKAWEDVEEGRVHEEAWGSIAPESEAERLESLMEKNVETIDEPEDIPELSFHQKSNDHPSGFNYEPPKISQKAIQQALRNLNDTQQKVFYKIRDWTLQVVRKEKPDPFFLFLTGGAGTGKSHLIKCIYHETSRILSKFTETPDSTAVLLMAPTGTAAFNIQGMTIHSGFAINKNVTLPYRPLGENLLNSLRSKFDSLQILIVDEISMVDQKILTYIHGRLSQIKHCKQPFGNVSILAVGDFYQLPPVRGLPLYKKRPSDFLDLWNGYFSVVTLNEVMRQKDDSYFAGMLNRLRVHIRGQPMTDEDAATLLQVSRTKTPEEARSALHIFPTNKEVHNHNLDMIAKVCHPIYTSVAKDFYTDIVTGHMVQKEQPFVACAAEDLQTEIQFGISARVMLIRNLDTEDGLVNGAFGTVVGIDLDTAQQVRSVYVKFDNIRVGQKTSKKQVITQSSLKGSVNIKPFVDVLVGKKVKRKQLPLKLAWAATIHKVQGMTVHQIVVSLKKIFQPGMAYVGLSRATSLSGLHILDFNQDSIYASENITEALQSMSPFLAEQELEGNGDFKIILHNTEGLLPHLSDVEIIKDFKNADIICFTETWLNVQHKVPDTLFPRHHVYSVTRSEAYELDNPLFAYSARQERGGVAIFVNKKHLHRKFEIRTSNLEVVACFVNNALFLVIYRPPSYTMRLFIDNLTTLLQEIQSFQVPCVILGDFNTDVLKTTSEDKIVEKCKEYRFNQLIKTATTEGGTCLDLVFVRDFDNNCRTSILPTYYGYHDAVKVILKDEEC